jgi:hypothetical protein
MGITRTTRRHITVVRRHLARKVKIAVAFEVRRRTTGVTINGKCPKVGIDVPVR